ncbi:MAG: endonuclease III [Planctomycetia bacterium]|nr:endonuclease III [Planctomycetia bacterium]
MDNVHKRASALLRRLKKEYPDAQCTLDNANPFELLIATLLSAQCTDRRVNLVTRDLFKKYRSPADFLKVPLTELETDIKSTGFYHNKAKNIQALSRVLVERYAGQVPPVLEELTALPGVGRKTANVVLGNAFGIVAGFVVDTHVLRLAGRLGLSTEKTPEKVERDLMALFPQDEWVNLSHRLILLGRGPCQARRPECATCFLANLCEKNL